MIWAFDIETGPLDPEEIEKIAPEFEPGEVKTGNITDLKKIAEKVSGARSNQSEKIMISKFWSAALSAYNDGNILAGHNIKNFDLPYLVRRSFKLGLCVPSELRPERSRFWPYFFFDTMEEWSMGDNQRRISLDRLARHLGLEGKSGSGKGFSKLYQSDQAAALDYLKQDLKVSASVAEALAITLGKKIR